MHPKAGTRASVYSATGDDRSSGLSARAFTFSVVSLVSIAFLQEGSKLNRLAPILISLSALVIASSMATAEEVDINAAKSQMEKRLRSFGTDDAILAQMNRKGRTDDELEAALNKARSSLAECIVKAVVAQAQAQDLPATPVLRLMSGVYLGPEDVEDASEIDVIKAFDFEAMDRGKQSCHEAYRAEIDARVKPADN